MIKFIQWNTEYKQTSRVFIKIEFNIVPTMPTKTGTKAAPYMDTVMQVNTCGS